MGVSAARPPEGARHRGGESRFQRVGMFGGAFDPPHAVHRTLAEAAVQQLGLDRLHVVPTGQAWHKARTLTAAAHRLAMAEAAFGDLPGVVVDDRELRRDGPSYTADTLRELAARYPGATLFLVLGEDQAEALPQWHAIDEVIALATLSIAARAVPERLAGQFGPNFPAGARTAPLRLPESPLSATAIRQRLAAGLRVDGLVPPAVASYIARHHLYGPLPPPPDDL